MSKLFVSYVVLHWYSIFTYIIIHIFFYMYPKSRGASLYFNSYHSCKCYNIFMAFRAWLLVFFLGVELSAFVFQCPESKYIKYTYNIDHCSWEAQCSFGPSLSRWCRMVEDHWSVLPWHQQYHSSTSLLPFLCFFFSY